MTDIPILVTAVYVGGLCLAARVMNAFIRHFLPRSISRHFSEALAAFFICALSLEKSHVRHHYGDVGYTLICVIGDTYTFYMFPGLSGSVCETWNLWLGRKLAIGQSIVRIFLQIVSGLAALQFARFVWFWELSEFHNFRYTNFVSDSCTGDLNVSMATGFAIEFAAALIGMVVYKQQIKILGKFAICVKSFLLTMVVLLGIDSTGMYYNPMNATNNNFGCQKVPLRALLTVYWSAPLAAFTFAHLLSKVVSSKPKVKTQMNGHQGKPKMQNGHVSRDQNVETYRNGDAGKKKAKKRYYVNQDRMAALRKR